MARLMLTFSQSTRDQRLMKLRAPFSFPDCSNSVIGSCGSSI
jgi:hypothetical protein